VRRPEPEPVKAPEEKPSPLKTYTSDFLQRVKERRASKATIIAAEQDSGQARPVLAESSRSSLFPIIAAILLFVAGGIGVFLAYLHFQSKTAPVAPAPVISAPIFVDERTNISVATTSALLLQAMQQSLAQPLAQNSVRLLYSNLATTTGKSVFSMLQLPAPDVVLRNVVVEKSMAGIVNAGDAPSVFFILSVSSYPDTFAGLLSWEPLMPHDLAVLYPPYPQAAVPAPEIAPQIPIATTTATTTAPKTTKTSKTKMTAPPPAAATTTSLVQPTLALPPSGSFRDEVVDNHDVRIYRDTGGRSVMLYGYWNKSTLVIARDPAAFTEILRRLATTPTQ
jgi:hypothetical protein